MRLQERGLVFNASGRPLAERVTFFDSLHKLSSGTCLSGFTIGARKHDPNGTIRVARSLDGGKTWHETPWRFVTTIDGIHGSLAGPEFVEVSPGRLLIFAGWFDRSDPDRPMFDPTTEGIWHSRLLMAESTDEGLTWGQWQEIKTPGLTGCALTGPPLRWQDGTIGVAFESFKHYDDPNPATHAAWLILSRDGCKTFQYRVRVAKDPNDEIYFWDQRLCPTKNSGEFVGLFWTHHRTLKHDLNVHFLKSSISNVVSSPVPTSIPGQIASPLVLDDNSLLAFVVDRDRPGTLKLWRSDDGGQTWPTTQTLVVHSHDERAVDANYKDQIDFSDYWDDMRKWSFGHPAAKQIDSNHVLLTFYAGSPDEMSIHWALIELD